MKKIKIFTFAMLAFITLPAFALPTAQRSCSSDNLKIDFISSTETHCQWIAKNDAPMQVTLLANHQFIPLINATCIFTPATPANGKPDAIVDVVGHKAATVKNVTIRKNVITFEVYNDSSDSEQNLNVIFYLNKDDTNYTVGNQIHCIFSAAD